MYFRRKTSAGRSYLQIVESRRDGDQVRQQVIATLGRFEELQASGQLERLVRERTAALHVGPHRCVDRHRLEPPLELSFALRRSRTTQTNESTRDH
jgi:hypothetical protein